MSEKLDKIIVERAIDLIEKGWVRRKYAKDELGFTVDPCSDGAVSFCAVGALVRAAFDLVGDKKEARRLASGIDGKIGGDYGLAHVNYRKGRLAVMQLLKGYLEHRREL